MAGLWPAVVRIDLPSAKFDQSSSGTVQREAEARQVKYFDRNGRVFCTRRRRCSAAKASSRRTSPRLPRARRALLRTQRCTCAMRPRCRCSVCCCSAASSRSTTLQEGLGLGRTRRWRRRGARRRTGFDCEPMRESACCALSCDDCWTPCWITRSMIRKTCSLHQDARRCLAVIGEVLERDGLAA